ncbi:MAG TPA: hypothetical protein PK777_13245, partial [Thermoguttaceae bacterium]|nr:hypothetical protein [Thermoguttaceae bacterium]
MATSWAIRKQAEPSADALSLASLSAEARALWRLRYQRFRWALRIVLAESRLRLALARRSRPRRCG